MYIKNISALLIETVSVTNWWIPPKIASFVYKKNLLLTEENQEINKKSYH